MVSSQGPCLVRGPPCGRKAGLFPEEDRHCAIWAPQTTHLPPGAVYMLLGAEEGVPISLCDTLGLEWYWATQGQRPEGWWELGP